MGGGPISGTPITSPGKKFEKTKKNSIIQNAQKNSKTIKHNRRALKRNKRAKKEVGQFIMYGNNCNKIGNKMESFNKVLGDLTPSVFTLQETKRKLSDPPIKANNLSNYQVFELKRELEKKDGGNGLEGG